LPGAGSGRSALKAYTDQAFSHGYANQPGMTDETQANAWRPVVIGIQAHGALAIAEMTRSGRKNPPKSARYSPRVSRVIGARDGIDRNLS
jgi:2,4-dienoyl-CoA reductase-like NADH-dependent reductase (Old Yellow Enzyme family)